MEDLSAFGTALLGKYTQYHKQVNRSGDQRVNKSGGPIKERQIALSEEVTQFSDHGLAKCNGLQI